MTKLLKTALKSMRDRQTERKRDRQRERERQTEREQINAYINRNEHEISLKNVHALFSKYQNLNVTSFL